MKLNKGGKMDLQNIQKESSISTEYPIAPKGYWTEEKIIETFNNPPKTIKNVLSSGEWRSVGYRGMLLRVDKLWGGWPNFIKSRGLKPLTTQWTEEKIIETFNNPPDSVKDKTNSSDWEKAGYGRMISKVRILWGGWPNFTKSRGLKPFVYVCPTEWTKERIIERFNNPPDNVKNRLNSGAWEDAGYGGMTSKANKLWGGWPNFIISQGLKPLKKHIYKTKYIDWESVLKIIPGEQFLNGTTKRINLKKDQIQKLLIEVQNGNIAAKEILIKLNERRVEYFASKMSSKSYPVESIENAALRGFIRAIELANPYMSNTFNAYAKCFITGYILKEIRELKKMKYLDAPIYNNSGQGATTLKDSLAAPTADASDGKIVKLFYQIVNDLKISDMDKKIVEMKFLHNLKPSEIGNHFNLKEIDIERVIELHKDIITEKLIELINYQEEKLVS